MLERWLVVTIAIAGPLAPLFISHAFLYDRLMNKIWFQLFKLQNSHWAKMLPCLQSRFANSGLCCQHFVNQIRVQLDQLLSMITLQILKFLPQALILGQKNFIFSTLHLEIVLQFGAPFPLFLEAILEFLNAIVKLVFSASDGISHLTPQGCDRVRQPATVLHD